MKCSWAPDGAVQVVVADAGGSSVLTPSPGLSLDTAAYHYLAVAVDRDGRFTFCVDGDPGHLCGGPARQPGQRPDLHRGAPVRVGGRIFSRGGSDLLRVHRGRALSGAELQDNWRIIQGQVERLGLSGGRQRPGAVLGLPAPGGIFLRHQ